jgi:hypothetical protein
MGKRQLAGILAGILIGILIAGPGASAASSIAAVLSSQPIYLDGVKTSFTAYNIDGNNYVNLRDVMAGTGCGVEYTAIPTPSIRHSTVTPWIPTLPLNRTEHHI